MATYTKIDEEGLQSERATEAAPNKAAWVSPDPRLLFHLPLDLAVGFVETAKQVLSSDEKSLDSAFAEWGVRRIFSEQCLVVASPGRLLHHGRAGYLRGMPVLVQQRPRWSRPGGGCCPGGSFAKGDRCGRTETYARRYAFQQELMPNEPCIICAGTGIRKPGPHRGAGDPRQGGIKCNSCEGAGYVCAWASHYPFSTENVAAFAAFLRESGGFSIQ